VGLGQYQRRLDSELTSQWFEEKGDREGHDRRMGSHGLAADNVFSRQIISNNLIIKLYTYLWQQSVVYFLSVSRPLSLGHGKGQARARDIYAPIKKKNWTRLTRCQLLFSDH
jgi:hypothetical protein